MRARPLTSLRARPRYVRQLPNLGTFGQEVPEEEVTSTPLLVQRGFVAVPTPDLQEYMRSQFMTAAAGFVIGMTVGALFGNLLARRKS